MKSIGLTALSLCAALSVPALSGGHAKRMDEDQLCRKLEDCYKTIKSVDQEKGKVFDIYVERLSYLVLVAESRARGSKCLDAVFSRIQKESPTLVVPRFVMNPAALEKFMNDLANENDSDLVYSTYLMKARCISELIADAKKEITRRSGFVFDPKVQAIRTQ